MTYKVVITSVAQSNIEKAIVYYKNNVSVKVASLFLQDFKHTINAIQKVKYFNFFFDHFRGKPLKKFPFIVFYTLDESSKIIMIKAVFNTNHDTNKYPKNK